jgi:hypothetical protein
VRLIAVNARIGRGVAAGSKNLRRQIALEGAGSESSGTRLVP